MYGWVTDLNGNPRPSQTFGWYDEELEAMGIPINDWILFLRRHSDNSDPEQVTASLRQDLSKTIRAGSDSQAAQVIEHLEGLARLLVPNTLAIDT
jgi:hypothetical protein